MATAQERAQAHYARWLQAGTGPTKRIRWTDRGITFTATAPFLTPDGNGIGVTIAASDANGPLPTDNPYQFFNPPLGVVVQAPVYNADGDLVTPIVLDASDPIRAAKAMVYDAVTLVARRRGWTG